jgi:hypothetical protein
MNSLKSVRGRGIGGLHGLGGAPRVCLVYGVLLWYEIIIDQSCRPWPAKVSPSGLREREAPGEVGILILPVQLTD